MAEPLNNTLVAIDRAVAAFVSSIVKEFTDFLASNPPEAIAPNQLVRSTIKARFFMFDSGAVQSITIEEDCYCLGCSLVYTSGQVAVTKDGSSLTATASGTFRELTGLVAMAATNHDTLGKIRTFLQKGTVLTISVNSGNQVVCLGFDVPVQ